MLGTALAALSLVLITSDASAEYRAYPNALPDAAAQASISELLGQLRVDPAIKPSLSITTDTFEQVLTFYQPLGREFRVSYPTSVGEGYERELPSRVEVGADRLKQVPSGLRLKQAFLILDGASNLFSPRIG